VLKKSSIYKRRAQYTKEELNIQKKSSIYKRRAQYTKEELNIQKKSSIYKRSIRRQVARTMWTEMEPYVK
jgi:hypothetical protein